MSWQKHYMDQLEPLTIENLPEPYKTWCDMGEKPYAPWTVVYRMVVRFFAKQLERFFPAKYGSRTIPGKFTNEGKVIEYNRYYPGLSAKWYPYGQMYDLNDVPDDILFPAMEEAETDFIAGKIDAAKERRKYGEW